MSDIQQSTFQQFSAKELETQIWDGVLEKAADAGLDLTKLGDDHREIVFRIAQFLKLEEPPDEEAFAIEDEAAEDKGESSDEEPEPTEAELKAEQQRSWLNVLNWLRSNTAEENNDLPFFSPIIICGVPGTGKTTFLNVLDAVLREKVGLPDLIDEQMTNVFGRTFFVPKRKFNGSSVSLLSVRKWSELFHFYSWDLAQHRFDREMLKEFIDESLAPMRVVFADEVEIAGYSPTLPDMTARNLLVVATSNQYDFPQLDNEELQPKIYRFEGEDLRRGDPTDAVVNPNEPFWKLFDSVSEQPAQEHERLAYKALKYDGFGALLIDFRAAVAAPMHETQWFTFLTKTMQDTLGGQLGDGMILLLDGFSLDKLRTDYNAIIRFVWLFDAIEQLGIGVLVRNESAVAELSTEALNHMKVTIHTARSVTDEVKSRTLVGIGRVTSRVGQAGVKARSILSAADL
ncbi:MAG: hypothetical protein AAF902_16270 [Chloroflexota bacterium]